MRTHRGTREIKSVMTAVIGGHLGDGQMVVEGISVAATFTGLLDLIQRSDQEQTE